MKHKRIVSSISIIGLAALILMLNFTSPTEIGPLGVLLFFTTVYITFFGVFSFLIQAFLKVAFKNRSPKEKDYFYAAVLAFGPIMLLLSCSFGAVSLWTVSLIFFFIVLAEFLVYKKV